MFIRSSSLFLITHKTLTHKTGDQMLEIGNICALFLPPLQSNKTFRLLLFVSTIDARVLAVLSSIDVGSIVKYEKKLLLIIQTLHSKGTLNAEPLNHLVESH